MPLEAQLEQAIQIASSPGSNPDLNRQALDFIQQVRESDDGWQACLSLFVRSPPMSEPIRVVSLDILKFAIMRRLAYSENESLRYIKMAISEYIQRAYGPTSDIMDGGLIQNKLCQVITVLFVGTYMKDWPTFFDELIALGQSAPNGGWHNLKGIIFFLRASASVHDEVADTLIPRTPEEGARHIQIKDCIRERDVRKLVDAWQQILEEWRDRNNQVAELCLRVIGRWVSWIDISIVVNDTMMRQLFQSMEKEQGVRNAALSALTEIVGKKMKGPDKLELIGFLNVPEIAAQIARLPHLQDQESMNYDNDLAELAARLVNTALVDIIAILSKNEVDANNRQRAENFLQTFFPLLLRFLSDQYDEVSMAVFPTISDLLAFFRKEKKTMGSLPHHHSAMLLPILTAVVRKMKYDSEATWGDEDEQTDEADFEELRHKLKVMQDSITAIDEELYRQYISEMVDRSFERVSPQGGNGAIDWRELDLALYELSTFGELAQKYGGLFVKGKPTGPAAETLITMMGRMLTCNVADYSHPAIRLKSVDLFMRYAPFFEVHTNFIPQALESFNKCIHDSHPRLRTRSWYLFHRFVKTLRQHMGAVSETILMAVSDLLVISAEVPDDDDDGMSSENGKSEDATFESQLYLFEAVGCLISTPSLSVETKQSMVAKINIPVFSDIERNLGAAGSGDPKAVLQIHHDMLALGALGKGFSDHGSTRAIPTDAPPLVEEFTRTTEAVLVALERLNNSPIIREAARNAFSRLVGVLGPKILPCIPRWISGLMAKSSSKEEISMFLKLLEQIVHNFKTVVYDILNGLLTPLLQGVFASLSQPTTDPGDEEQLAELRREFLNFVLVIINNDLGQVLVSEVNRENFETVLKAIEHCARETSDPKTEKVAFNVLTKLSFVFGPSIGTAHRKTLMGVVGATPPQEQPLSGFEALMSERFATLCWEIPYTKSFNIKDAQGKNVLGEIALLQKILYLKLGDAYLQYLKTAIFPQIGVARGIDEYCDALQRLEGKEFKNFFQKFVQEVLRS